MSSNDWRERVVHIIDAAASIQQFMDGLTEEEFVADRRTVSAVAYQITIIGEASNHVPPEVRDQHPEVPWSDMRAMRNLLAHHYFRLDASVLWDTATNDIPPLLPLLRGLLKTDA